MSQMSQMPQMSLSLSLSLSFSFSLSSSLSEVSGIALFCQNSKGVSVSESVSEWVSQSMTRPPIELFWAANNQIFFLYWHHLSASQSDPWPKFQKYKVSAKYFLWFGFITQHLIWVPKKNTNFKQIFSLDSQVLPVSCSHLAILYHQPKR